MIWLLRRSITPTAVRIAAIGLAGMILGGGVSALAQQDLPPEGPDIAAILARATEGERIVNGYAATKGQWPSMAAIMMTAPDGRQGMLCGGTVIGRQWVLTAAHCASAMIAGKAKATFSIREGVVDLTDPARHDLAVTEIIVHERYVPQLTLNDVALLRLAGPTLAPRQRLVARSTIQVAQRPGLVSTVIGFGATLQGGSASTQLLQVEVPIVQQAVCVEKYTTSRITDANFCAGYAEGRKDSCQGDSGGPLFVPNEAGEQMQVGIVSYGRGCAQPGFPGVYASVGSFQAWIKDHVPDAEFVEKSGPDAMSASLNGLTQVTGTPDRPSQLAQVTLDIVEGDRLKVGTQANLKILSSINGAVVVLAVNPDLSYKQIYPSARFPAPGSDPQVARIEAGKVLTIPSPRQKDLGRTFRVDPPTGLNGLIAIVMPAGPRVDAIIRQSAIGSGQTRNLSFVVDGLAAAIPPPVAPPLPHQQTDRAVAARLFEIVP